MPASALVPALLVGVLEEAAARLLALDPHSGALLRPLAGKVLAIRIVPFSEPVFLYPTAAAVQVHRHLERAPDVVFSGTPWAFARIGLSRSPEKSMFGGGVRIEGDTDLARHFRVLLKALHIDWEAQLAGVLGDNAADRIFAALRAGRQWGRESLESLGMDIAEYLQEESRELPTTAEVDGFLHEVDVLRADCDRLDARLARLAAALPRSDSGPDAQGAT